VTDFFLQNDKETRVLVADDHQLVREMIASFLSVQHNLSVSVAENYQNTYQMLESDPYDIVLLDVQMPGMNGISSIDSLVRNFSETSIVIFSGVASDQYVQEAFKIGVKGYIPKTFPFKSLLQAIKLVAGGEPFIPSSFANREKQDSVAAKFGLSDSELTVLRMVSEGMSNKEIARQIDKTEVLVKMHMRGICKRLGAQNRTQAAIIALKEKLI